MWSKFHYQGNDIELLMKFYSINHSYYHYLITLTKQAVRVILDFWVFKHQICEALEVLQIYRPSFQHPPLITNLSISIFVSLTAVLCMLDLFVYICQVTRLREYQGVDPHFDKIARQYHDIVKVSFNFRVVSCEIFWLAKK